MNKVYARRASLSALLSSPVTGFAFASAVLGHPKIALVAALIAAALIICPVVWVLRQEVRR